MSSLTYTILVAEDDDSIRHALTDVLTASGYEVLAAEEGLAAIRAVRERNFDLAL
ncbi:MAG: response regulator, partial [Akkermansia sp.]|nr:response regulator [Akkermansia sp.]